VFIERPTMDSFLAAYRSASVKHGVEHSWRLNWYLLDIDFDFLRRHRDEIVQSPAVPEGRREKVARLVDAILANEERMKNALKLRDLVIAGFLQAWLESKVAELNPLILEEGKPAEPKKAAIEK